MFTKNGVASETGVAAAAVAAGAGAAAAGAGAAGAAGAGAEADGAAGGGEVCAEAATANVTTAANPRTSFRITILSPPFIRESVSAFRDESPASYHLSGKWCSGPTPAPAFNRSAAAIAAVTEILAWRTA